MAYKKILLDYLADGKFHSGQLLAEELEISRTAIWKHIRSLRNYGLDIYSVPGKGYRLSEAIEPLNKSKIRSAISIDAIRPVNGIEIFFEIGSTNQYLIDKLSTNEIHGHVALAEYQSAGRGSRGRTWASPFGSGIWMSIGWHFESQPDSLSALSLVIGVAIARALRKIGVESIGLKWPNDIICNGKKLGGILIESRGETVGPCDVVIGIAINVSLPTHIIELIDQPVTDLARINVNRPSRNFLAGSIISETITILEDFSTHGFSAFFEEWREFDRISGKEATLILPNKLIRGRVLGIDKNGMLSMSINGEVKLFSSGEISLRVAE